MSKKSKAKFNLAVVAHPDDELIFFGGLILRNSKQNWKVICVTDGNADGMGHTRQLEFNASLKALKVNEKSWLGFPDIYEKRLNLDELEEVLRKEPTPKCVYTHGPLGEYGHPHHQDVSYITHKVFADKVATWSPAWSSYPDKLIHLSPAEFKKKSKIFLETYHREAGRFLNLLPVTSSEAFVQLKFQEVEYLYECIKNNKPIDNKHLKKYAKSAAAIHSSYGKMSKRLF